MAQVKWTDEADALFDKYIMNAFVEYGRKTSMSWLNERIKMVDRLVNHPTSYPPEELLSDRDICFRSHQIMGRFKFVHYYDEETDTVFIVDIWDMKMNPKTLIKRINNV